jgi:predicted DNA-binding transcriptional regulator AlpA
MVANIKTRIVPLHANGVPILQMTQKQVCAALSISKAHLYRKISSGDYPPPVVRDVGNRWDTETLLAWHDAGQPPFKNWYPHWEGRKH